MDNFIFRTKRIFESKYEYEKILKIIERIKSRCQTHKIRESFSGHPANVFEGLSLGVDDSEEYLHDDFGVFFDAANNLLDLNESLSGKYGWDTIADVIETQTGVGVDDWHWTLNTYMLKPEYAQLLIDNLNCLESEIRENYETFLTEEIRREDEREVIRNSIKSIDSSVKTIADEGGKTKEYTHTITFHDGETLIFSERNVFDFGIVINPSYCVNPRKRPGGLCLKLNGVLQWCYFLENEGWMPIRPLTENENTAMAYLRYFGGFSGHGIRM